eukprot:109921-Amphidinium_carterae.1
MPESILLALACTAWAFGWRRLALGLLLGFLGMLRPAELVRLRRMDIALPQDLNGSPDVLVIAIAESKTSTRAARLQSTMITDVNVIALAQGLLCDDLPSRLVIAGGLPELSRKYVKLTTVLGLKKGFTLGTLRGGGAVRCLKQHKSLSSLQWLGRWSSERSTHHYLQLGVAAATWIDLPSSTKSLVQQLASHADTVLNPFLNGVLAVNDVQKFFPEVRDNNFVVNDGFVANTVRPAGFNPVVSDAFVANAEFVANTVRQAGVNPVVSDAFVASDEFVATAGFVASDVCKVFSPGVSGPFGVNNAEKFLATRAPLAQSSPPWGFVPASQTEKPG